MYRHIFGPVPSRRLGISLGIDLVPKKVCSLNCVYCEVGRTTILTTKRDEYVPYDSIQDELIDYFSSNNPDPEYITFSGYGEPTLHSKISDIVELIKKYKPNIPIAILTNGTLLSVPEVRESLLHTDIVLPSLDAVSDKIFKKINRPERSIQLNECIQGLVDFRKKYKGKIFLEVFILPGYNDENGHLEKMRDVINKIQPDKIQLNTLDRPGLVKEIFAATEDDLIKIKKIINLKNIEIISKVKNRKEVRSYRKNAEAAILETIARRPCTIDDLATILGLHVNEINKYLDVLGQENKIESVQQERGRFYKRK
jgi:wyosine [tRNA(Phe)-imidazoG37] synthetase (radical SAM superfamily)